MEKIIYHAFNANVLTKFEPQSVKKLPKTVTRGTKTMWFNNDCVLSVVQHYIKGQDIYPFEKICFGKIKLIPQRYSHNALDERIEPNKEYYGWKIECVQGYNHLSVVVLLPDFTQAMDDFQQRKQK